MWTDYLLSFFAKDGQIPGLFLSLILGCRVLCSRMIYSNSFSSGLDFVAAMAMAVLLAGCAASDPPLNITLHNPTTGVQRVCAAKGSKSTDMSVLANAVEACARQLEAHGFVRTGIH
jgi:hypothetical protein